MLYARSSTLAGVWLLTSLMSPSFNHHGNAEPILTLIWLVFLFVLGFFFLNCISNSAKTKLYVSQPVNPKPVNSRMSDVRDKIEQVSTCLSAKRSFSVCQPTQHSASVVTCFISIPFSTDVSCDFLWTCKLPKLHCKNKPLSNLLQFHPKWAQKFVFVIFFF